MGDRTVRHQATNVSLHVSAHGAVDDAEGAQETQQRHPHGQRRIGGQRQADPQQAEGSHLGQERRHHHRDRRRSLGIGTRQPSVQRHQRNLDGKTKRHGNEQIRLGVLPGSLTGLVGQFHVHIDQLGQFGDRERQFAGAVVNVEHGAGKADERHQTAGEREQENLAGRFAAVRPRAPASDEEQERHQRQFEADIEEQQVEAEERPGHPGLQKEQPGVVGAKAVRNRVVREQDDRDQHHAGEGDEPDVHAVEADEELGRLNLRVAAGERHDVEPRRVRLLAVGHRIAGHAVRGEDRSGAFFPKVRLGVNVGVVLDFRHPAVNNHRREQQLGDRENQRGKAGLLALAEAQGHAGGDRQKQKAGQQGSDQVGSQHR